MSAQDDLAWTGDDPRIERIYAALKYVPLNLYDEVAKLAENAVGELIREHRAVESRLAHLEEGLRHIGYEMPVEERNPDGDEQAAYSMQLYARSLLADQDGAA